MAVTKSRTYLDTGVSGLVIVVEHNLGGTPDLFLTELDAGKEKYVSLYDPRISEIKALDANNTQLTFASAFAGFLELLLVEVDDPSVQERLTSLEDRYLKMISLIESKMSIDQWGQLNTLTEGQITSLQTQIDALSSQVSLLRSDVDAL